MENGFYPRQYDRTVVHAGLEDGIRYHRSDMVTMRAVWKLYTYKAQIARVVCHLSCVRQYDQCVINGGRPIHVAEPPSARAVRRSTQLGQTPHGTSLKT